MLPCTSSVPKWTPSFRVLQQISICTSLFPHMCHVPRPYYPPRFNHPKIIKNIWSRVEIRQLLITQLSPVFYYALPLRLKCLSQYPILEYSPSSPLYVTDQVSHSYKVTRKITVLFLVTTVSLECKAKVTILWAEWQQT